MAQSKSLVINYGLSLFIRKQVCDMEKMMYSTMDAFSCERIRFVDSGYYLVHGYKDLEYPATDIPVPMPTECPCCKKTMASDLTPIIAVNNLLSSDAIEDEDDDFLAGSECTVASIYRCTSCNSLFTLWSKHKAEYNENHKLRWSCDIQNQYPFDAHVTAFSDVINGLSPKFVSIYNQSELAESQALDELCGMGYRRALEFLVDSYIRKFKSDKSIDANLKLGTKISNYIDDPRIKTLAQKSAWLGNDATHIVNKHPNRKIVADMKKFIKAMTTMIEAQLAVEDADNI